MMAEEEKTKSPEALKVKETEVAKAKEEPAGTPTPTAPTAAPLVGAVEAREDENKERREPEVADLEDGVVLSIAIDSNQPANDHRPVSQESSVNSQGFYIVHFSMKRFRCR